MRKKTLMNLKKKHQEGPAATPAPPGSIPFACWYALMAYTDTALYIHTVDTLERFRYAHKVLTSSFSSFCALKRQHVFVVLKPFSTLNIYQYSIASSYINCQHRVPRFHVQIYSFCRQQQFNGCQPDVRRQERTNWFRIMDPFFPFRVALSFQFLSSGAKENVFIIFLFFFSKC